MATPAYLSKTQFIGRIGLQIGNYDDFNNYAYDIEQMYLLKLLGFQQKREYEVDNADGTLQSKYEYIISGILAGYEDQNGVLRQLKGFREMVKWFFYFHFVTEQQDPRTLSGDPQEAYIQAVNGSKNVMNRRVISAYNQGVDYYNEIVDYMTYIESETPDTYENWEYEELKKINIFGI